ncbi:MAG TPA: rhomboid family intramembrane serine protease, partial [Planctomycetota bacterium]|nr:rhomboid family intramembrane serine protease [Planctomycetota bacterium]
MGIEDREYYRDSYQGGPPLSARSMLTWIVGVNLVVWMVQVIVDGNNDDQPVTTFLACQATALFDGFPQVWKLITANFAHSLDR